MGTSKQSHRLRMYLGFQAWWYVTGGTKRAYDLFNYVYVGLGVRYASLCSCLLRTW